ncbi:MAG: alpha/beta hydrolase [Lawsonibacter sp.]|nr:alpha/beta hydrolase [Lawsonibacter sp.]
MKIILIHGSGHKSASWNKTVSYLESGQEILCPELSSLLRGEEASYHNLYHSFKEYCNRSDGPVSLCGISLGGILALDYALEFPEKVKSLVLIGTPHKVPKVMFQIQTAVFRFLPESTFETMAFGKKDTFILGNSMKALDFSGRVGEITCPTLLICGKKDGANLKSAYYFRENIPNAKLEIMENTGHVVNEERPQMLARILNEYYKEIK